MADQVENPRVSLARTGVALERQYPHPQDPNLWGAHPEYHVEEWMREVGDDQTRLGYWEWCAAKVLEAEEEHSSLMTYIFSYRDGEYRIELPARSEAEAWSRLNPAIETLTNSPALNYTVQTLGRTFPFRVGFLETESHRDLWRLVDTDIWTGQPEEDWQN